MVRASSPNVGGIAEKGFDGPWTIARNTQLRILPMVQAEWLGHQEDLACQEKLEEEVSVFTVPAAVAVEEAT